jgi:hypothetical protein
MKKIIMYTAVLCGIISFNACVKSEIRKKMVLAVPQFMERNAYYSSLKMQAPTEVKAAGKFILYNNYMLLQDMFRGIHIIDVTNMSSPTKIGFIPAGNVNDFAMKDNFLYLDCNRDLVTLNLSDINNITLANIQVDVFDNLNGQSSTVNNQIFTGYKYVDTVIVEDASNNYYISKVGVFNTMEVAFSSSANLASSASGSTTSIGGSMARFCIVGNYMYTVDVSRLITFNLQNAAAPSNTNTATLGWQIETVYPMKDKLFIGSANGMFIYSIANAAAPQAQGTFSHARVCDPVIADGNYAYVTLRSGTQCQGFTNQLDVVNITDVTKPTLVKSYNLTNPHGLSKKDNTLYICDGKDGLRIMNVADVNAVSTTKTIAMAETFDVIATGNNAFISAKDGIHLMDISNAENPTQKSIIK